MREEWDLVEDGIDWREVWNSVGRRKWAILSLALVVSILTALAVYAMTPYYSATALVHIQSEQANVVSIEEVYGVDTRRQDYYNTQAEIMKSRPIAAKVIAAVGAPPEEPPTGLDWLDFDWRALLPFKPPEPPGGAVEVNERDAEISRYLSNLYISPVRDTQLVRISYASPDPRLAAAYANAHAEAYIESILDARLSVTQSASSWMGKRVEELRENLRDSEARLQAFREQESLIDVEGFQALPNLEIEDLTTRLVNARRRLSETRIAYEQVVGNATGAIESVPAVLGNAAVQQFRAVQALAEQQVAELGKRYGPKHPKMIAAQSELAEATQNLKAQQRDVAGGLRAEFLAARDEVAALEADLAESRQQYQTVSRKGSSLESLQREVQTNRELYELFYSRMRETAQTGDLDSVNARTVQPAFVPSSPFKPNRTRAVALAFVLSLIIGTAAALLREHLNQTVRSSVDVKDKIGLPLLGSLPVLAGKPRSRSGPALFDEDEKQFAEGVRTLRTGITLSNVDQPHKVVLVTSSVSDEGKSTVALNLAMAFAQVEKVLLLDADLRRPSLARELKLDRTGPGLSELLAHEASITECISTLDGYSLEVLRTGLIPPDPLVLLSSDAVTKLMKVLRHTYDRIIIDSPPILPVSDAAVLSTHADAVLYVVKSDDTTIHQVKNGLGQLQRFGAPLTGVVINRLKLRDADHYGYYGGYEYAKPQGDKSAQQARPAPRAASL